ncbi:MAG TPA: S41 family peptidase, partial [Adhaeribacter sp.]|nr:S41 family peptidase [Adhaeribacter sp.]
MKKLPGLFAGLLSCLLSTGAAAQTKPLSTEEKVYGLSKFWQEANYNYAYFSNVPKLNFDSLYTAYIPKVIAAETDYEYYRHLQRFCASLKDGHTYIMWPKYLNEQLVQPQIEFTRVGNELYVTNTGIQFQKEIPVGSKVLAVNNTETLEYLNEEVYPYFTASTEHILLNTGAKTLLKGQKGTKVTLNIQKPGKKTATVEITRSDDRLAWVKPMPAAPPIVTFKMLDKNTGMLALNSFANEKVLSEFKEKLPELRKCKALVLDLRNNNGGISTYAYEIVKHFTQQPQFVTLASSTRKHLSDRKATAALSDTSLTNYFGLSPFKVDESYMPYLHGNVWETAPIDTVKNNVTEPKLLMPVAILTSNKTVSAAEDFLIAMENVNRGVRIGQPTKGSTGQPYFFRLPGGGFAAICTRRNT